MTPIDSIIEKVYNIIMKTCCIDGCNKIARSKGLCDCHYRKLRLYGDPLADHTIHAKECKVDGCNKKGSEGFGYCRKHYVQFKKWGDPLFKGKSSGRPNKHMVKDFPIEYTAWQRMKARCLNKNNKSFKDYGGRGITICDRWLEKRNGFSNFVDDLGRKPSPSKDFSLGRIDNNKGYSPDNCRWETWREQDLNKRNTNLVEYNGEKMTLNELSKIVGVPQPTLHWRLSHGKPLGIDGVVVMFTPKKASY